MRCALWFLNWLSISIKTTGRRSAHPQMQRQSGRRVAAVPRRCASVTHRSCLDGFQGFPVSLGGIASHNKRETDRTSSAECWAQHAVSDEFMLAYMASGQVLVPVLLLGATS